MTMTYQASFNEMQVSTSKQKLIWNITFFIGDLNFDLINLVLLMLKRGSDIYICYGVLQFLA